MMRLYNTDDNSVKQAIHKISIKDRDQHSMAAWIRIRITIADPYPGGLRKGRKKRIQKADN
jgi:hypothetical protein